MRTEKNSIGSFGLVISMGRMVETHPTPCAFVYGQGGQGFLYDGAATKVMHALNDAKRNGQFYDTPAVNYVPRMDNNPGACRHDVQVQLALTDPDFRERAEALATLLEEALQVADLERVDAHAGAIGGAERRRDGGFD